MSDLTWILLIAATAFSGVLAGASLDQSIKQLPARHRLGAVTYSAYAQAADLGSGLIWYIVLGIGTLILTLGAAIAALANHMPANDALPVVLAAGLAILHSLATTQAAPTMFSQRKHLNDEAALTAIFNRFERWQTLRAFLQALTFAALLWALVVYGR